jgi:hypothetical protein
VANPTGLYTIFDKPFTDKPRETWWWSDYDVRGAGRSLGIHVDVDVQQWEANWSAIPKAILNSKVGYDEELDRGIGYENQDYAFACKHDLGARIILDTTNHAFGLPHKLYFPKMTQENGDMVPGNRAYVESKWA